MPRFKPIKSPPAAQPPAAEPAASKHRGRNFGATSPAIRRSARKNGAKHVRERLPEDMLAELGDPPVDILERNDWYGRALDVVQVGVLRGRPWTMMLRDLQRSSVVASKLVSEAIKARLAKLQQQEQEELEELGAVATERKEDSLDSVERTGALRRTPN